MNDTLGKPLKRTPMKSLLAGLLLGCALSMVAVAKDLSVLVVTGGHPYDTPEFEEMFKEMEGVKPTFVQLEEMQKIPAKEIDGKYAALVLLDMVKAEVDDDTKQQYLDLTEAGTGLVFLHFTIHEGVTPLLESQNSATQKVIAWENRAGNSKVIYLMPGFTKGAYENGAYRTLVRNAIGYVAK